MYAEFQRKCSLSLFSCSHKGYSAVLAEEGTPMHTDGIITAQHVLPHGPPCFVRYPSGEQQMDLPVQAALRTRSESTLASRVGRDFTTPQDARALSDRLYEIRAERLREAKRRRHEEAAKVRARGRRGYEPVR